MRDPGTGRTGVALTQEDLAVATKTLIDKIEALLTEAEEMLMPWPSMREGFQEYIADYIRPFLDELGDLVRARAQQAL